VGIVLGPNQYGKAETRLVRVDRDGGRHTLHDLNVSVALRGELAATHLSGDNSPVLPTDSQKNTVYAFARQYGVDQIEAFGLCLARHFVDSQPTITAARVSIEEYGWTRLGPHSFARDAAEIRTAVLTYDGARAWAVSGVTGLVLLNSTGSEFWGYIEDPYTTLPETRERILATAVTAWWRHEADAAERDWSQSYRGARDALVESFVDTHSLSLQQTLYQMGRRVLRRRPEIVEVRLSLPNRHHLLVDLAPFGLNNPNEVFVAADRPYGLIEGTVLRDDAPEPGLAWW
jgi:urate oxidase